MDTLVKLALNVSKKRHEEDVVDRWNYQLTAYIFTFSTIIITTYTYMAKPIICWTPAEFRGGWNEYARDYCFVENTYYVPMEDPSLPQHYVREKEELPYYQWVQFVLVILAFFFFVPHLVWRSLNWWSGLQVRAIVSACSTLPDDESERNKKLETVTNHIFKTTFGKKRYGTGQICDPITSTSWVTLQYLIMKLLFLLNIIIQLFVIHLFLGFDWGDLFSLKLGFNTDWKATGLFPRSTMCDFEIRNKGNVQRYSVQCVLSQNMFNEKIFLVLFYWLIALFVVTLINTGVWVSQIVSTASREEFTRRMLHSNQQIKETERFQKFVELSPDLIVLLRLISSNAGDSVCSQVTGLLHEKYENSYRSD